jgi:CheY-like chemotaxis protein
MKTILVLDDNRHILEALSANLCIYLKNCAILTAVSCAKADAVLKSTPVDLILTDLDMPAEDGYQFIKRMKEDHPAIGVCAMSGDCTPPVIERLKAVGVDRYLEKPFPLEDLVAMISEELKRNTPGSSAEANRS